MGILRKVFGTSETGPARQIMPEKWDDVAAFSAVVEIQQQHLRSKEQMQSRLMGIATLRSVLFELMLQKYFPDQRYSALVRQPQGDIHLTGDDLRYLRNRSQWYEEQFSRKIHGLLWVHDHCWQDLPPDGQSAIRSWITIPNCQLVVVTEDMLALDDANTALRRYMTMERGFFLETDDVPRAVARQIIESIQRSAS